MIVRSGPVSLKADRRVLAATAALSLVSLAAVVAGIALGEFPVPPLEVLASLAGAGSPAIDFIVLDLRLPRVLIALLAGAALGMSGAVFQQVARNTLVAPDVVGVVGGASLAAVAVIVFGPRPAPLPLAALAGALVVRRPALRARVAARDERPPVRPRRDRHGRARAGRGRLCADRRPDLRGLRGLRVAGRARSTAAAGSTSGRSPRRWRLLLAGASRALAWRADMLELGDDLARALGVHAGALAAGAAGRRRRVRPASPSPRPDRSASWPSSPHTSRAGSAGPRRCRALLPLAAACGAALVVVSDLAGRMLFAPTEIPVGLRHLDPRRAVLPAAAALEGGDETRGARSFRRLRPRAGDRGAGPGDPPSTA